MSEYMLAGIFTALLSLIFSKFPFVQLVYILSIIYATNWNEFGMITVTMLMATVGANVYKTFQQD